MSEKQSPVSPAKQPRRSLHVTGAACVGNTVVGLGKLAVGLMSLSLFTCVSALYTFGMVTAKCIALAGLLKAKTPAEQYRYYKASGLVLILASLFYVLYSLRLFLRPEETVYHEFLAIGIAAFTFAELTLNLRGVIIERKNHAPLVHAIKTINLAASLICLVLTQSAILSFASERTEAHPAANGLLGVILGVAATLLGAAMLIRIRRLQKKEAQA